LQDSTLRNRDTFGPESATEFRIGEIRAGEIRAREIRLGEVHGKEKVYGSIP
jgi:hypothetical protein